VTYVPILLTFSTKSLATFVAVSRHEQFAHCATSFTFINRFSLCRTLLVGEIFPTPKMSVTFVARETNVGERARRAGHAIATRLGTDVGSNMLAMARPENSTPPYVSTPPYAFWT